jgi:hypothetical protein
MGLQSCKNPNFENFETPNLGAPKQNDIWCKSRGEAQRILQGGRWWLSLSPDHGESCEYVYAHGSYVH